MTVSTRKKRVQKKKRKNKLAVFAVALFAVMVSGTVLLALLTVGRRAQANETQMTEPAGTALKEPEEKSLVAEIAQEAEGFLGMQPENAQEQEESRYGALLQDAGKMKQENIYAKEAASPEETVLCFAGDILFDPSYAVMAKLLQRGGRIEDALSEELLQEMRSADIFMVNNEFPYSDRGEPLPGKQFTFRASPKSVSYLEDMGADIVSLANNHASDYGEISLLDTLDTLEAAGIPYVGAGRNLAEASRSVSFIVNDTKITFLSATQIERNDNPDTKGAGETTPGTFRCWNVENLLAAVTKAKEDSDFVIVYIHWGTENQAETDWAQKEQAPLIAKAGADLIIGDHSHCLQPVGFTEGVPVLYSLGNFWFNSKTLDTCLAKVAISKTGELSVQILPAKQEDCRTRLLQGEEKQRVISYINGISENAHLDENGILMPN